MADARLKVINENTVGQQMVTYSVASSYLMVFGTNLITVFIDFSSALSNKKWLYLLNFIVVRMFS